MDTPTRAVIDAETNEVVYIPFTAQEIADRDALAKMLADEQAAKVVSDVQQATIKASGIAALVKLGLTPEQAAAVSG